jgi:hypothetical protein
MYRTSWLARAAATVSLLIAPSIALAQYYPPSTPLLLAAGGTVQAPMTVNSTFNVTGLTTVGGAGITSPSGDTLFLKGAGTNGAVQLYSNSTLMATIGGTGQDIAPNTYIFLPGGTWGSGALAGNTAPITQVENFAGSTSNPQATFGMFLLQNDNSTTGNNTGITEELNLTGTGVTGAPIAINGVLNVTTTTGNTNPVPYVGITGKCNLDANDGLSGTPSGGSTCEGGNFVGSIGAGIEGSVVGVEFDTFEGAGAIIKSRLGVAIADTSAGVGVQALVDDDALEFGNQYAPSSSLGFKNGISFGSVGANFPVFTAGTLITGVGAYGSPFAVDAGIDWRLGTFSTAFFQMPGASMDGSGTLRLGHTFLSDSGSGLTITPTGSVGTAATPVAGGSGFAVVAGQTTVTVGDGYHGRWAATISGGQITALALISAPYIEGTPPVVAVPLTALYGQPGTGATATINWGTGTSFTIAGTLGLTVATWADTNTCTAGQVSVDSTYIYVCTASNTVKRAALASF